ncbi:MAG: hypothetical protein AMS23_09630 [Bacteroides sp. SM1_62]|nr:MAG: hypothetical protein AMS26_01660 [Bacteroides sp. SM23_62]KPL21237.1 MAG: hypothetical protein AMS23_09630 [Bacteroides sp. SM1_62]
MDSCQKLAKRLDQIPNGFPKTGSGVELRLLAKLFTPEEAALALNLNPDLQSVKDTGCPTEALSLVLKSKTDFDPPPFSEEEWRDIRRKVIIDNTRQDDQRMSN